MNILLSNKPTRKVIMPKKELQNPVGKLYLIIRDFKNINPEIPLTKAITKVFKFEKNNSLKMYECIQELLELVLTVKTTLQSSNIHQELYEKSMSTIENVFNESFITLNNRTAHLINNIPESVMVELLHLSHRISEMGLKNSIPLEILEKLCAQVIEMKMDVLKLENIDYKFKLMLLSFLEKMEKAIYFYIFFGKEFVDDALKDGLSTFYYAKDDFKGAPNLLSKFSNILDTVNKLAETYSTLKTYIPQIAVSIAGLLASQSS
jgi:hypothetical protein